MASVEIETPEGRRRLMLERDRLRIGRLSYNDIVLAYAQISRQHAELRRVNGRWWIVDLHSTNGLLYDTRRIQEHALKSGDLIMLAPGVTIRFVDSDTSPSAAAAPTRSVDARLPAAPAAPAAPMPL